MPVRIADDDAGRAQLLELVGAVDVVIESKGAGDLAAFGLARDEVREQFPALVVVTISGFGTTGPYADYTWSDLVAQTAAWVTFPQGRSLEVPVRAPRIAALCSVGHTAALGALAGTLRARASGAGAHVDVAAFEALGQHPGARVPLPRVGVRRPRAARRWPRNAADTLLPDRHLPLRRRLRVDDVDAAAAQEMLEVIDDDALTAAFARPDAFSNPETKEILDTALYPWLFEHTARRRHRARRRRASGRSRACTPRPR